MSNTTPVSIWEDKPLLSLLLHDSQRQKNIYKPGPYWNTKTINSINQIKKFGLGDFRGHSNAIGLSYSDNLFVDIRTALDYGFFASSFKLILEKLYPFNKIFQNQVELTYSYAKNSISFRNHFLKKNVRLIYLLSKYKIPYSILGGAEDFIEIDGQKIAYHYINLLDEHDRISDLINFNEAKSFFEIGGGFGINVHILLENYPIKKVIYLDIVPNLYVGTQYLKSFYGKAVKDYRFTRSLNEIKFSNDDTLEIFAIAPWQIENLKTSIDIFQNSHSFVEMTDSIISNYANKLADLPDFEKTKIILISYGDSDFTTTVDPEKLPLFFPTKCFKKNIFPDLVNECKTNNFYISQ